MDDFDVKNHDQEIDDLLSEVKGLLGEEPEQPEEDSRDTLDAPQKAGSRCGKTRWKTPGCRTKHRKDR